MNWFNNLKTGLRMALGFAVLLVLMAGIVELALSRLESQNTLLTNFADIRVPEVVTSQKWAISVLESARHMRNVFILDQDKIMEELAGLEEEKKLRLSYMNELEKTIDTERGKALWQSAAGARARYVPHEDEFIALVRDNQLPAAKKQLLEKSRPEQLAYLAEIYKLTDFLVTQTNKDHQAVEDQYYKGRTMIMTIGVLAIVISGILAYWLTRSITVPLQLAANVAKQITIGDFTGDLSTVANRRDEMGVLARSISEMANYLREQIRGVVEGVNALVSEIVASSSQLAASAAESAAAVAETTTTVEEVRQTAEVASQKARAVSDSAQQAAQNSELGRKSTAGVVAGMSQIRQQMEGIAASMVRLSEQSQTIGQIIASVEDLAAQSNLLAVNAAIEASRAGEQGKGFGVVAQEVKSLAEQSRQATYQVRTILNDIQKATTTAVMATEQGSKAVEAGEKQAAAAGESIEALADSVGVAAQAAIQIAASGQQQLVGVDQVAKAMENINQASVQNMTGAQQLETAARNLNTLGAQLKQMVDNTKMS